MESVHRFIGETLYWIFVSDIMTSLYCFTGWWIRLTWWWWYYDFPYCDISSMPLTYYCNQLQNWHYLRYDSVLSNWSPMVTLDTNHFLQMQVLWGKKCISACVLLFLNLNWIAIAMLIIITNHLPNQWCY